MVFPFFSHTSCPVWQEGRICSRQGGKEVGKERLGPDPGWGRGARMPVSIPPTLKPGSCPSGEERGKGPLEGTLKQWGAGGRPGGQVAGEGTGGPAGRGIRHLASDSQG